MRLPEGELLAFHHVANPFLAGLPDMDLRVAQAIAAALGKPDYARLTVPALALYATPGPEPRLRPWYDPADAALMDALRELEEIASTAQRESIEQFRAGVAGARVVELVGADHWIFLSHEEEVLREMEAFLSLSAAERP